MKAAFIVLKLIPLFLWNVAQPAYQPNISSPIVTCARTEHFFNDDTKTARARLFLFDVSLLLLARSTEIVLSFATLTFVIVLQRKTMKSVPIQQRHAKE